MIDEAILQRWSSLLKSRRFRALDGYVNALTLLARHLLETGQPGIRCDAVVTGAEYLSPAQRSLMERAFGCPIFNRYGSSEAGFIAHECAQSPLHELHINAELLWLEFIRDRRPVAPGKLGEILLTDFTNHAMPLIRYQTNDVGIPAPPDEQCPCGRGLPLVRSVEGRVDDLFYLPDGQVLVSHVWHEIFADQEFVRAYRLTQHRRDLVEVEIVAQRRPLPDRHYRALQRWVEEFLPGCTIIWSIVDEIRPGRGGKLRSSRSTLAHPSGF
jgi:phenylacetate-CoA ligase